MALPPVTTGMLIVFALILAALVLFILEPVPNDVTAIGVMVSLVVAQPWTGVDARSAILGFASPATVTIVAMYILSSGIQETGLVGRLGVYLARWTRGSESRLLGATIGSTGVTAGFINNTPVVAVFIPMIRDLAEDANISPSKLLMPLSFAAMLGGTLTLVGTSTNILASDLSARLLDHPISMFEFTSLGVIVLLAGAAYLMTVGRWLVPERIPAGQPLTERFELDDHLARLTVREASPIVGRSVEELVDDVDAREDLDLDVLQVERDGEAFLATATDQDLEAGDVLTVRAPDRVAQQWADELDLTHLRRAAVDDEDLGDEEAAGNLAVVVVLPKSGLVGETLLEAQLEERFDTTALAVRRDEATIQTGLDQLEIEEGDTLLVQTTSEGLAHLVEEQDVVVSRHSDASTALDEAAEPDELAPLSAKTPIAVAIMVAVIAIAAVGWLPIVITALGGVVAMVATRCIRPAEAYDAVSWNVIFLLAGVIPLGLAMQQTGGAAWIAQLLVASADVLPAIAVLGLFYVLTGVLANIITPVASVVLMIPIAVDTATQIGAEPFTFLLGVMFAGSAAFMTPIGYQTNLMVYGPGGYTFTDYLRVGAPLQLFTAVVTTVGLAVMWGV